MELISLDNQLFSVVDDFGFHRLVEHYQVAAIFQMLTYQSYTELLKLTSMSVTAISFTTDIRTSDVSPMSIESDSTVGRPGFHTEESRIACPRMCWFSYRCCHFKGV
jgi:hypothetical protein